jgi:hypothetical protein
MRIKTKFSSSAAKTSLGTEPIQNTAAGMTEAFIKILSDQGFEINAVEIKRWCEFQYRRRCRNYSDPLKVGEECKFTPKTIKADYVITNFRTYMNNWYDTHRKWLRAMP